MHVLMFFHKYVPQFSYWFIVIYNSAACFKLTSHGSNFFIHHNIIITPENRETKHPLKQKAGLTTTKTNDKNDKNPPGIDRGKL